ncbi:hypothetical protein [Nostoc sp. CCY0012]
MNGLLVAKHWHHKKLKLAQVPLDWREWKLPGQSERRGYEVT